jgi:uncharacterized protein (TIGR00369 family)
VTAEIETRIAESFARQGLMGSFGAEILSVSAGHVVLQAPIRSAAQQQHGFAHAGLTFALGDSAAGYAALTTMPPDREVVTSEMKINLLAPGKGAFLRAEGRVIRAGKRLVVVTAEVFRDDGEMVALMQGTMIPVSATA